VGDLDADDIETLGALLDQRDMMLTALKAALETWGDDAMYPMTTAKVKDAIAKAEGGQP
jgi:hypothetical protein